MEEIKKELNKSLIAKSELRIENLKVDYRRYLRKKDHIKALVVTNKIIELRKRIEGLNEKNQ